jgi:hypothetical protein
MVMMMMMMVMMMIRWIILPDIDEFVLPTDSRYTLTEVRW